MASKDFSILDMQNNDEINLQFQDFGNNPGDLSEPNSKEQTVYFSNFPDSAEDEEQLIGDESENRQPKATYSFWTFEYYQQYFDVESKQVSDRILWSMFPKPGVDYLQSYIRPNHPDLYGPFWICTTLVMTTAIMGNISNYLQNEDAAHWKYDFHKVSLAASSVFSYAWLVPVLIWGIVLWRGSRSNLNLLELICMYGYSLSVYIPISIIWTVPVPWLQWCLGIVGTVLSGGVLVRAILPAISHESKKIAVAVSIIILILHGALAISFMVYFFHIPASSHSITTVHGNVTTPVPADINKITASLTKRNDKIDINVPLHANVDGGTVIKNEKIKGKADNERTIKMTSIPNPVLPNSRIPIEKDKKER